MQRSGIKVIPISYEIIKNMTHPIKLIVGLRNAGQEYQNTRHNAGSWLVEALTQQHNGVWKRENKLQGDVANIAVHGVECRTFLPHGFMNHSGLPVQAIARFYRIQPEEILIVHDELDLPIGRIKLKSGGGNGGHNGLRDIMAHIGSSAFLRLRIGIGHPGHKEAVHHYVLSKPSVEDKQLIINAMDRAIAALPLLLTGQVALAMNTINS